MRLIAACELTVTRFLLLSALWLVACAASHARAEPVQLDVTLRVVDAHDRPLPDRPVRLVFESDPDWAAPDAGRRARTDAHGEARFSARVELGAAEIDRDTTWLSVLSPSETARSLTVFVGLEYLGMEWLYGLTAYRFDDGDGLRRGFDVYLPDERGRYTLKFSEDRGMHTIRLPDGLSLSGSGNTPRDLSFAPAPDGDSQHWVLTLSFRREPDPVRR